MINISLKMTIEPMEIMTVPLFFSFLLGLRCVWWGNQLRPRIVFHCRCFTSARRHTCPKNYESALQSVCQHDTLWCLTHPNVTIQACSIFFHIAPRRNCICSFCENDERFWPSGFVQGRVRKSKPTVQSGLYTLYIENFLTCMLWSILSKNYYYQSNIYILVQIQCEWFSELNVFGSCLIHIEYLPACLQSFLYKHEYRIYQFHLPKFLYCHVPPS